MQIDAKSVLNHENIREKVLEINKIACNFFISNLKQNNAKQAREYLDSRQIDLEQLQTFKIGFADSKSNLYDEIKKRGFSNLEIEASKLFIKKGLSYHPFFRDRVIFPIQDKYNNVVGFSGRDIENKENSPKYLNTGETIAFKKGDNLYNINNVKSLKNNNEIIYVEGYMDVIALDRVNIKNAVALMGTAMTEQQIKLGLSVGSVQKIYLDNDEAGYQATLKIGKELAKRNCKVVTPRLTDFKDADEAIRANCEFIPMYDLKVREDDLYTLMLNKMNFILNEGNKGSTNITKMYDAKFPNLIYEDLLKETDSLKIQTILKEVSNICTKDYLKNQLTLKETARMDTIVAEEYREFQFKSGIKKPIYYVLNQYDENWMKAQERRKQMNNGNKIEGVQNSNQKLATEEIKQEFISVVTFKNKVNPNIISKPDKNGNIKDKMQVFIGEDKSLFVNKSNIKYLELSNTEGKVFKKTEDVTKAQFVNFHLPADKDVWMSVKNSEGKYETQIFKPEEAKKMLVPLSVATTQEAKKMISKQHEKTTSKKM